MDSRAISKAKSTGSVGQLIYIIDEAAFRSLKFQISWPGMGPWNVHFDKRSNPGDFAEDGSSGTFVKILGRQ